MAFEFKVPELGENIASGDVVNVLVREGQQVAANQGVVELETDKAVVEIPCPQAGRVSKVHVKKGDTVRVGQLLLTLEADGAAAATKTPAAAPAAVETKAEPKAAKQPAAPPPPAEAPAPPPAVGEPLPAGPAVRRLARELGVDLAAVHGSGKNGRITEDDVRQASGAKAATPAPAKPQPSAAALLEPVVPPGEAGQDHWGPVRRDRLTQVRKTIAAHMVKSATTIPHVTNFDDADLTDLERLRKSVPAGFLGANVRLTAMPFVMKAVAAALRRHPLLNASLDEENQQVVYKQYVHLGVAVDTPRGLIVPVLRDVDRMSIPEIARALVALAERARQVQFTIEELRGGTFTLSNLGAVGGTYSTPIINHPEVAILLLGRGRWLPMVRGEGEQIEPRFMLPLSLSYDHRLVDGAAAGRFLNEVIDYLQSPAKLLLM